MTWLKPGIDRRDLIAGAAAALLAGAPGAVAADEAAGQVTSVDGEALAERQAKRRALVPPGPVFVGDLVLTGSGARAALLLGKTTRLHLGERTRVTIDRFVVDAGGTITLGRGALLLDKSPSSPSSPGALRINSSYAVIAVRGTRVFAGPSNGVFGVFVDRGSVSVSGGGRTVVLETGQGTDIASPGADPTPARPWGEARIRAALASVG